MLQKNSACVWKYFSDSLVVENMCVKGGDIEETKTTLSRRAGGRL